MVLSITPPATRCGFAVRAADRPRPRSGSTVPTPVARPGGDGGEGPEPHLLDGIVAFAILLLFLVLSNLLGFTLPALPKG